METKTEKMEWSKPILEELGKARYSLGAPLGDCMTGVFPTTGVYIMGDGVFYITPCSFGGSK